MSKRSRSKPRRKPKQQAQSGALVIGPGLILGLLAVALSAGGLTFWLMLREPGDGPQTAVDPGASQAQPEASVGDAASTSGTGVTPEGHPFIGAANAAVTIEEFSDYQCPNCRQFATEIMPWLKESWLRDGFVRVIFRDFAVRGPASEAAAEAAHCASEQGQFWAYHDGLFAMAGGTEARALERAAFEELAGELGLKMSDFSRCLDSGRYAERVRASSSFARGQGFEGTPTYLINGRQAQGAISIADWEALFRAFQTDMGRPPEGSG